MFTSENSPEQVPSPGNLCPSSASVLPVVLSSPRSRCLWIWVSLRSGKICLLFLAEWRGERPSALEQIHVSNYASSKLTFLVRGLCTRRCMNISHVKSWSPSIPSSPLDLGSASPRTHAHEWANKKSHLHLHQLKLKSSVSFGYECWQPTTVIWAALGVLLPVGYNCCRYRKVLYGHCLNTEKQVCF